MAKSISSSVTSFLKKLRQELASGKASERSYYPALKSLIENCGEKITVQIEQTGEPGTPDLSVTRKANRIGIVEVKDISVNLQELHNNAFAGKTDHNSAQFRSYLERYDNIIYTNCIEWRRYREGKLVQTAVIAHRTTDGKLLKNKNEQIKAFKNLIAVFLAAKPEPLGTPEELALEMARLTRVLRDNTKTCLDGGNEYLKGLHNAFRKELVHGLKHNEFADMYAETVAYGLFTARMMGGATGSFDRTIAAKALPKTNPFLRGVFKSLADDDNLPSELVWIVEDLASLIGAAKMHDIAAELERFGDKHRQTEDVVEHDPIIYFYEHFLRAYDPKKAKQRGVYYTPLPVVSYIVRSIDELLKSEFDKPRGLADQDVVILDPACGTGTFLYEVVRLIWDREKNKGPAHWNDYVPRLLQRLFGFELLMAPYTIAHLKLSELLRETGYEFPKDQRLGVYLTNTLEQAEKHAEQILAPGVLGSITKERIHSDRVKLDEPVMVVLGNPPYSGHSANKGKWICNDLLKKNFTLPNGNKQPGYYEVDGKPIGERNTKWLQNDYVKFIRWAQWKIAQSGRGIIGIITPNRYYDGVILRGMRQNLISYFDDIYLLDLYGSIKREFPTDDGSKDENVFNIEPGVAISIFIKGTQTKALYKAGVSGQRAHKYKLLSRNDVTTIKWDRLAPIKPYYLFIKLLSKDYIVEEYGSHEPISIAFTSFSVAIVTGDDKNKIGFSKNELKRTASVNNIAMDTAEKCNYRLFDKRFILYDRSLLERDRYNIMKHFIGHSNIGLVSTRQHSQYTTWRLSWVTSIIIESCFISDKTSEINYVFPLYKYPAVSKADDKELEVDSEQDGRQPNLSDDFVDQFLTAIGAERMVNSKVVGERSPDRSTIYPEDIFYYIYAVLHSPTYRERYAELLKIDFPRIPLPKDYASFDKLAASGQRLTELHLLKDKENWDWGELGQRGEALDTTVCEVAYDDNKQEVVFDIKKPPAEQLRIGPVPPEIWNFHVGGYQVLNKWLKDRKGRNVTLDEYVPIIIALKETDMIMRVEIDPVFKEMLGL
ncbi:MAG: N-6 DNA methylase [Candidatus Coatesbacteria bacterium]|nr:N-6 DNA methylase [Candidatus Coatesbacteria bacterium]